MTRLPPVPTPDAGWGLRITYWFTGRAIERLTSRRPDRMIEPIQVYAHNPRLLGGYALSNAPAPGCTPRTGAATGALAELRAATTTACEFCIDLGSQVARRWGLPDEEILTLAAFRSSPLFSDLDTLVLDYASAMSSTPVAVRAHGEISQVLTCLISGRLLGQRGRLDCPSSTGAGRRGAWWQGSDQITRGPRR